MIRLQPFSVCTPEQTFSAFLSAVGKMGNIEGGLPPVLQYISKVAPIEVWSFYKKIMKERILCTYFKMVSYPLLLDA